MSCYYRALPRLIPELILLAGSGAEIAIVSPWIENVSLLTPRFGVGSASYAFTVISLHELLLRIIRDYNMHVILLLRGRDKRLQSVLGNIPQAMANSISIREFSYIHAKMIVTPLFVLETSANMLQTSLSRNIESCTLIKNPFEDTRAYIRDKLGIFI